MLPQTSHRSPTYESKTSGARQTALEPQVRCHASCSSETANNFRSRLILHNLAAQLANPSRIKVTPFTETTGKLLHSLHNKRCSASGAPDASSAGTCNAILSPRSPSDWRTKACPELVEGRPPPRGRVAIRHHVQRPHTRGSTRRPRSHPSVDVGAELGRGIEEEADARHHPEGAPPFVIFEGWDTIPSGSKVKSTFVSSNVLESRPVSRSLSHCKH